MMEKKTQNRVEDCNFLTSFKGFEPIRRPQFREERFKKSIFQEIQWSSKMFMLQVYKRLSTLPLPLKNKLENWEANVAEIYQILEAKGMSSCL